MFYWNKDNKKGDDNLKNLQEYLKITIKQHYIPKVYLRHFKIENLEEKEEKILVYNKLTKIKKEIKIEDIFYEEFLYTNVDKYFEILLELKDILRIEYNQLSTNIYKFLNEQGDDYTKLLCEYENEIKEPLKAIFKEQIGKQYRKKYSYWAVFSLDNEVEEIYSAFLSYFINMATFLIISFLRKTLEIYMYNSIKVVEEFLQKKDKNLKEKNNIKKISNSFFKLVTDLENINSSINDRIKKVEEEVQEKQSNYSILELKYAQKFNAITSKCLYRLNTRWAIKILKIFRNYKKKENQPLEDTLNEFEDGCIFNINQKRKSIFEKNRDTENSILKNNFIFNISKYILVQFYRYPSSQEIDEKLLREIIDYTDYKKIKNSVNIFSLIKAEGILIKIDEPLFITSDNPVFIRDNILIFTLTPNLVYLIMDKSIIILKQNFWQLEYQSHKDFIKNVNYFIFENAKKNIILSDKNNLDIQDELIQKISLEEFSVKLKSKFFKN